MSADLAAAPGAIADWNGKLRQEHPGLNTPIHGVFFSVKRHRQGARFLRTSAPFLLPSCFVVAECQAMNVARRPLT